MQAYPMTIPPTSPSYRAWSNAGLQRYHLPEEQKENDILLLPAADLLELRQSNPDRLIKEFCYLYRIGKFFIDGQAGSAVLTNEEILQQYIFPCFDNDRAKAEAFLIVCVDRFDEGRTCNLYQDKTSKDMYLITKKIGHYVDCGSTTYTIPGHIQTVYRWNPAETKFELDFYGASNCYVMYYSNNSDRNKNTLLSDIHHAALYEKMLKEMAHRLQLNNENHISFVRLVEEIEQCSKDEADRDLPLLVEICTQVLQVGQDYLPRDQAVKDACLTLVEQIKHRDEYEKLVAALQAFVGVAPTPVLAIRDRVAEEAQIKLLRDAVKAGKQARWLSTDESFNHAAVEFYNCLEDLEDSDLRVAPLLRLACVCQNADQRDPSPGASALVERDRSLLTQIFSQTTRLIKEPTTQLHIDSYLALAESAKHCHEGIKLATAMLAVAGAALLTSAFLTGAGFIALPLLTSNLIAQYATAVVGVGALYKGLSFFHDAYTQHRAMEKVSEAMLPVVPALSAA